MKGKILMSLVLGLVLIFSFACAKKQVVVPSQPAIQEGKQQPTTKTTEEMKPVTTGKEEKGKVAGLEEEKIREEELARQQKLKKEQAFKQEIQTFENEDIHFDFDKYNIRPDAASILERKAAWLKTHPNVRILIEGHCDDWGSEEYNLALGERRANSAKEFLINLGVNPDQISIISYGEERPAVVPPAYCESVRHFMHSRGLRPDSVVPNLSSTKITPDMVDNCQKIWAKNRRCHFVVIQY